MSHTRIKICGITHPDDARAACAEGADAIGLVFYKASSRAVSPQQAVKIAAAVPPFVQVVALFVDESVDVVNSVLRQVPVSMLQFHGNECADYCRQFARPYLKALRVRPGMDLAASAEAYDDAVGILLDSWQAGVPGGTGKTFDWQCARGGAGSRALVLAGGLRADNVARGMNLLRPAAVDVSGGVEREPGRKDTAKIREFIAAVRAGDHSNNEN